MEAWALHDNEEPSSTQKEGSHYVILFNMAGSQREIYHPLAVATVLTAFHPSDQARP